MPAMAEPHFLVVTYPAQGHINPARHLALRLLRATGARITVSTAVSACRKMFPGAAAEGEEEEEYWDAAGVCYVPYSDGYDGGFDRAVHDHTKYMAESRLAGSRTLAAALARFRAAGRPVTRVLYTLLLSWVGDVARRHGVPAALYWIQPASVLAAYFHFFHGTDGADKAIAEAAAAGDPCAAVRVPGLPPPLRVRDLPSFLTISSDDHPYAFVLAAFRDLIDVLAGEESPVVLANTFEAMEPDAVASLRQHGLDVIPVGPVLSFLDAAAAERPAAAAGGDLFTPDDKGYLEWLDSKPASSVVYISFGSLSVMSKRQIEEVARGMAASGRPFLWVLRKDNRGEVGAGFVEDDGGGMVVEWCDQARVLSHAAVGCFVTHCGWNSTLESVACGVPVVGVPQWTDQGTNAWLVERLGVGVRASVGEDGILEAGELRRCLDFAASDAVRGKAALWREKARAAVAAGGSSERNLRAFVGQIVAGGDQ